MFFRRELLVPRELSTLHPGAVHGSITAPGLEIRPDYQGGWEVRASRY
ncbi:hypothetical protein GCM10010331_74520 [Streptomyces xanthochromogenes]|nr:hypothetical protein [Streptomyces xanthochromogenes]GHB75780.1 hypothetical protein GCM10010331_74520 [Streptomyces xanthochromogenes]